MSNTPPVYLLSLRRDAARRSTLVKQLTDLNIDFRQIDAVNGAALSQEQIASYHRTSDDYYRQQQPKNAGHAVSHKNGERGVPIKDMAKRGPLTAEEIGCALSHLSLYRKMVTMNIPWSIILEDDAMVLDNHIDRLFHSIYQLEQSWHIIFLDYIYIGIPSLSDGKRKLLGLYSYASKDRRRELVRHSLNERYYYDSSFTQRYHAPMFLRGRRRLNGYSLAQPLYNIFGSHAYAISRTGAAALLHNAYPLRFPADTLMSADKRNRPRTGVVVSRPIGLNPALQLSSRIHFGSEATRKPATSTNWRRSFGTMMGRGPRTIINACLAYANLIMQLRRPFRRETQ